MRKKQTLKSYPNNVPESKKIASPKDNPKYWDMKQRRRQFNRRNENPLAY